MREKKRPGCRCRQEVRQKVWPVFLLATVLIAFCLAAVCWVIGDTFQQEAEMGQSMVERPELSAALPQKGQPAAAPDPAETPWYLTLVNRWNPLPENYTVTLVEVPGGEQVDERIYKPLLELLEAAKEENQDQLPVVVSGYRTQEMQQSLYNDKVKEYRKQGYSKEEAADMAEQWVAVPGYSEHQLGFAVDINGATYDLYFWLQENSYKYGFIFRYPGSKTDITGTAEEVWHYRYVGTEAAKEIHDQGLCLEEYLLQSGPGTSQHGS